jgi:hypothetical protein
MLRMGDCKMLKQRREAAEQVAECLFAAETAIDEALVQTARLAGVVPALRKSAGVSAFYGQSAIERTIEALSGLGQVRASIVMAHKELSETQRQVGLGAVAFGPGDEKPPHAMTSTPQIRPLHTAA